MRLIDVDYAIEKINCLCVDGNENWIGTENQSFVDHADVIDILSSIPTVECRFNDAGRCTYGDGAPECAKEKNEHGKM